MNPEKKIKHKKNPEQEFYNALIESSGLTKKNVLSSLYGYNYGFEISYPKKISTNISRQHVHEPGMENSSEEFLKPPEFVPFQNFEFTKSGSLKRKNSTQINKKFKLEKFFSKLKKNLF